MTIEINENTDSKILRVFVIRHGQTNHNVTKILQGHLDSELNDVGRLQASKVGAAMSTIKIDDLVSSDLQRCARTMDYIKLHHPDVPVRYTENLRERNMGSAEGMHIQAAIDKYGPDFRNLGENSHQLITRIDAEWKRIVKMNLHSENIILCTHGGVITGYINSLYRDQKFDLSEYLTPDDLKVPFNTSVAMIDVDKKTGKGIIQMFGNTDHLGGHYEVEMQNLF